MEEPGQFMKTQRLDNCLVMNIVSDAKKAGKSPIGQLNSARFVQHEQTLGHAVKKGILLRLKLVKGGDLRFFESCNLSLGGFLGFLKSTTPPEMQSDQSRESNDC